MVSILSTRVHNGEGWQVCPSLPGKEQFARGSSCVAASDETLWQTAVADDNMGVVDDQEQASSSSEPVPDGTTVPVLKTWSSIKELHFRLRELGALVYGTKDVLFRRLCEYEQVAAKKKNEAEYLESTRRELALATEPVTPKILPGPVQPPEVDRDHHMVNHLPPAPWCELCVKNGCC